MASIVVGIDGSENARAALRWAAGEAAVRNATLRVVYAWEYPYVALAAGPAGGALPPLIDLQEAATATCDQIVDEAELPPGLTLERVVREGSPARVLLEEAAKDADLLVVGSRGHGGFVGLLVGSVATQVVNHAEIPTVVVPGLLETGD
jgi:nucleotide-binding universal stress UspA family protein